MTGFGRLFQVTYAAMFLLLPTTAYLSDCAVTTEENGELYRCHSGDLNVTVRITVNVRVTIYCKGQTLTCENFPAIPATHGRLLPTLHFESCSLPPSLTCLMEKLGASEVSTLRLEGCSELAGEHIQNINGLTSLWIWHTEHQKTIPFEAMAAILTLTKVNIHNTKFKFTPTSVLNLHLRSLELTDSITELPEGVFKTFKNLVTLSLDNNYIQDISPGTFEGLDNLELLDLSRSHKLSELPARAFAGAPRLREIKLCTTGLETVAKGAFEGLTLLEKIEIKRCSKLLKLADLSLADLPSLKSVTIESCKLSPLTKDLFRNSKAIVNLTISSTSLDVLPDDIFHDQTDLKVLKLDKNKIKILPERLLYTLVSLEELNLTGNLIEKLPGKIFEGLVNLKTILMDSNHLTSIPRSTFNGPINLFKLSLKDNQLTLLEDKDDTDSPFSNLMNLEEIDLSGNLIDKIFDDWRRTWIHAIRRIDLSRNRIRRLRGQDVEFLGHNVTVDLQYNNITTIAVGDKLLIENSDRFKRATFLLNHNPIECDCSLHAFLKFIKNHKHPIFVLNNTVCKYPHNLAGRNIKDVPLESLTCNTKHCPNGCACITRPETSTLELDCFDAPKYFPDPETLNLTTSKLRLHNFESLMHLPKHTMALDLHNLGLTEVPAVPDTVSELNLANNHLRDIDVALFRDNLSLYISGNEINCDCLNKEILEIIIKYRANIKDFNATTCEGGLYLHNINLKTICDGWWATIIGSSLAVIGIVAAVSAAIAYYYIGEIVKFIYSQGWPLPPGVYEDEIDNKKYDVLISYSDAYEKFVISQLMPMLRKAGYSVCLRCVEWDIGDFLPHKVPVLVDQSRRTVVLLSSDYFDSDARLELKAALINERRCKRKRVLVVVTTDLKADPSIERFLQARQKVELNDATFWERLMKQLPRKRKKIAKPNQRIQNILMTEQKMLCNSKMSLNQL